jgi:hypothetical protein
MALDCLDGAAVTRRVPPANPVGPGSNGLMIGVYE